MVVHTYALCEQELIEAVLPWSQDDEFVDLCVEVCCEQSELALAVERMSKPTCCCALCEGVTQFILNLPRRATRI